MIAIQCIETWWTKASRGGPGAAARAASPSALRFALPTTTTIGSGDVALHRVVLDERSSFEAAASSVVALSLQEALRQLRGVVLHAGLDALDVQFTWSEYTVGAPSRRNGPSIRLEPGRWCRVIHNGRMAEERQWWYQQTTLNVAFRPSTPTMFLHSEPDRISDHRESLR